MKEHLLHFIWQNKLFNTRELKTTAGDVLQVMDFGRYNRDGGPDFQHAVIRIEDIILAGNIELHVSASDWHLHKHESDQKYGNVILHVVYFNDAPTGLPTLELNGRIFPSLLEKYEGMMLSPKTLICSNMLKEVDAFTIGNWKERLLIERLERKSEEILERLSANRQDWELTAYHLLGKYFGSHINKEAFEMLTHLLPLKILARHKHDAFQSEALLFGTAGFLEKDIEEDYPQQLKREYRFLKHKYHLKHMEEHQWQFLRIRPVSFPTIRIAWFSQLVQHMPLFGKLLSMPDPGILLEDISASEYWESHYVFGQTAKLRNKVPGEEFRSVIRINVLAPLLFAYGKYSGDEKYIDKAMSLLENTRAEHNVKTRIFEPDTWEMKNAFHTQALIEMYDHYCSQKRCLQCAIGCKILKTT